MAKRRKKKMGALTGFVLGAGTFVVASYVLHCGFGMGPWPCQRGDRRCK